MVRLGAEIDADRLRDAVERLHGCPVQLVRAVPVREAFEVAPGLGRGVVHVFDLGGHRSADRCYAWSARVEGCALGAASSPCSTHRRSLRRPMPSRGDPPMSPRLIGMPIRSAGCPISTILDFAGCCRCPATLGKLRPPSQRQHHSNKRSCPRSPSAIQVNSLLFSANQSATDDCAAPLSLVLNPCMTVFYNCQAPPDGEALPIWREASLQIRRSAPFTTQHRAALRTRISRSRMPGRRPARSSGSSAVSWSR